MRARSNARSLPDNGLNAKVPLGLAPVMLYGAGRVKHKPSSVPCVPVEYRYCIVACSNAALLFYQGAPKRHHAIGLSTRIPSFLPRLPPISIPHPPDKEAEKKEEDAV